MLKGHLKTTIKVNQVNTTCKIKVLTVSNLMEEDQFGNPAYKVKIHLMLDGVDAKRKIKIKYDKEMFITNMHVERSMKIVKDFNYHSVTEGVLVTINEEGRILDVIIPYGQYTAKCIF